jgi:DNA replication protein DnaC
MKETRANTSDWAKWLKVETFGEPGLENLVNCCADFARGVVHKRTPFWLSILGASGTGKTHCATQLWELQDKLDWGHTRYIGHVIYWPKFVEQLRELVREGYGTSKVIDMGTWPLLVLDDVGAERDASGFAAEKLNLLLGMRVGRWTVITSNLTLKGISKIDDRIASRMVREPGNLVIEMTNTKDYGERNNG